MSARRSISSAAELHGVWPALFTPLKADDPKRLRNSIDTAKARSIIDDLIAAGVTGLVPVGTTGQSPTVSPEQHLDMIRFTVDYVAGRVPVIAGAGSNSTRESVDMIQAIQRALGDTAVLCVAGGKQPVRFHLADDRPFTFAGIWDRWKDADGTSLFTCAIITTAPNDAVRPVHDRMPVIVPREAREAWLDPSADDDSLIGVLKPYPGTDLIGYAVSARVNSVANDDADCIEPFEERPEPQLDLSTEPTRR
jgi:hypothetical protein